MRRPRLSPALFALICVCFVLPFATVSCNGAETSFTGVQLATRTVPVGGHVDGSGCSADIGTCVEQKGSSLALVALVAAVVGLLLGLFGAAKGPGWCAASGIAAMVGIGIRGFDPLGPTVTFRIGYWLILLLFLTVGCTHVVYARHRRRSRRGSLGQTPEGTTLAGTDTTP
jgi:hypothetical protein